MSDASPVVREDQTPLPLREGKGLSPKQVKFAHLIATGHEGSEAWSRAHLGNYTKRRCDTLLANPEVQEIVASIRKRAEDDAVLTLQEKRAFLAKVLRTPVGELSPDNPVASMFEQGANGQFRIKGTDKLKAIELDSKLAGDFDRHEVGAQGPMAEFIARIRGGNLIDD